MDYSPALILGFLLLLLLFTTFPSRSSSVSLSPSQPASTSFLPPPHFAPLLPRFLRDFTHGMTHVPALELQWGGPWKETGQKRRVKKVSYLQQNSVLCDVEEWKAAWECLQMLQDRKRTCWRKPKSWIRPLSGISWRRRWRQRRILQERCFSLLFTPSRIAAIHGFAVMLIGAWKERKQAFDALEKELSVKTLHFTVWGLCRPYSVLLSLDFLE